MHEYGWASIRLFVAGIRGRLFPAMRADPPREVQRDLRQADTVRSELEGEIDQLAQRGQLYGLSQKDIHILEEK
jgi:hypothetical protein